MRLGGSYFWAVVQQRICPKKHRSPCSRFLFPVFLFFFFFWKVHVLHIDIYEIPHTCKRIPKSAMLSETCTGKCPPWRHTIDNINGFGQWVSAFWQVETLCHATMVSMKISSTIPSSFLKPTRSHKCGVSGFSLRRYMKLEGICFWFWRSWIRPAEKEWDPQGVLALLHLTITVAGICLPFALKWN